MKTLEQTLKPLVEKAIKGFEQGADFVIDQAPLVIQEFYRWHIAEASLGLLLSIIGILSPYIAFRILSLKEKKAEWEELYSKPYSSNPYREILNRYIHKDHLIPIGAVGSMIVICGIVGFCIHIMDLVKILVAPRLYLIEYFIY